jgi:hypothetical protein
VPDERLTPDRLREFVGRDWARVQRHKAEYWHRRREEVGTAAAFAAADALREQMRAIDPTWPDSAARAQDLASHSAVALALLRAAGK